MNGNNKRRIEISVETREIKIVKIRGGAANSAYCGQCGSETRFFSPIEIAGFFQTAVGEIEQQIKDGELHLIGNGQHPPRICGTFAGAKTSFIKGLLNDNKGS